MTAEEKIKLLLEELIKKGKEFYTRGTHGGTYSKRQVPDFYQNELIEKL